MLTKKIACQSCDWTGYKALDFREIHHSLVCPVCKSPIDLDLGNTEVAVALKAKSTARELKVLHPGASRLSA